MTSVRAQAVSSPAFDSSVRVLLLANTPSNRVERVALRQLYPSATTRPLWTTRGRPTPQALAVIDALSAADAKGLRPADYDAAALRVDGASLVEDINDTRAAHFDVALSRALIHFLADLHMGRVSPRALRFNLPESHAVVDLAALALDASRALDVQAAIRAAEPPYMGYAALESTLARYRALAADPAVHSPRAAHATIRPGDQYVDLPSLRRLLVAVGDLDAHTAAVPDTASLTYSGALVDAVSAFQQRHGLEPDGLIGAATMAQMRVPMSQRVRQIELTLERWRWLPDDAPARYLVVNIPSFRLAAFENDAVAQRSALTMKVIVGQAEGRHGTPVFAGTMREVVLNPYWDVPPSIARKELLPLIRGVPGYFARESLEVVRGGDEDAIIYPPTPDNLARVAAGTLRLRQRPGSINALGAVKFVFPNSYNVYLHGTPAIGLFAEPRRDFSHGCIRIEDPIALAELVLANQEGWDRKAIIAAINAKRTLRVTLERPVSVFVLYATVVVRDGTTSFYPDLYGHDAALARALAATSPVR